MTLKKFFRRLGQTFLVIIIVCIGLGLTKDDLEMLTIGSWFAWAYFGTALVEMIVFWNKKGPKT